MTLTAANRIRAMRVEMKFSQEKMAEHLDISIRQYQRMENGEADIDIWKFMVMLEKLGYPEEDFWLMYLNSKSYEEYRTYSKIKRLLREYKHDEIREILPDFEKKLSRKSTLIRHFVEVVKIKIDKEMDHREAVDKLLGLMGKLKKGFEENEIINYRLTYMQISTLISLAYRLSKLGEKDRAINILRNIADGRFKMNTSEADQATILPAIMSNLAIMLGRAGRIKECKEVTEQALKICRECDSFRQIPQLMYTQANCERMIGEEKRTYDYIVIRAYHTACAHGDFEYAQIIKKDAEKDFGITFE